jgi:hypothetical protein
MKKTFSGSVKTGIGDEDFLSFLKDFASRY